MKAYITLLGLILCCQILEAQLQNPNVFLSNPPLPLTSFNAVENTQAEIVLSNELVYNCDTVFWTVNSSGAIQQWDLIGNQITGGDIVGTGSVNSIAFCSTVNAPNDLTFFGTVGADYGIKKYNNSTGWVNYASCPYLIFNNGGYYENQYYQHLGIGANYLNELYHYDGTTFTLMMFLPTSQQLSLMDTAVDSLGRAWVFISSSGASVSSSLRVYDINGLVTSYPFVFDCSANYGSFFLNDQLYVSQGNNIVPIIVNGSTVTTGAPIPFTNQSYYDIASCNKLRTLNTPENSQNNGITIYPNPVTEELHFSSNDTIVKLEIFNVLGDKIQANTPNNNSISVSNLPAGVYLFKATTATDKTVINRFIKQ